MKDKLKLFFKKIIIPIFISVLMGAFCGNTVYGIYIDNNEIVFSSNVVYLLQTGAYSNYNNMRTNALSNDYVYYQDAGMYKTIIGITQDSNNIEKIKEAYGGEIVVSKYLISDTKLYNKIKEFDNELKLVEDKNKINELVISMLKEYEHINSIEFTKIND